MSPIRVTIRRTIGSILSRYSTYVVIAAFFAAVAAFFSFNLEALEGYRTSLAVIWTTSISPILPVLAVLLSMDLWSSERASGRVDLLLSSPVRERDFVVGKFLGVWILILCLLAIFQFATLIFIAIFAPKLLASVSLLSFGPGFLMLALQSATWVTITLAISVACRRAAVAAAISLLFIVGLPRGIYLALLSWAPQGRASFGEMILDAHAYDMACGLVSSATVLSYIFVTLCALFFASKLIAASRYVGVASRGRRFSTFVVFLLSAFSLFSAIALVHRLDMMLDIPVSVVGKNDFSARTKAALSETHGEITITLFLPRKDAQFRQVAHFLRALSKASEIQGGAKIEINYVDPNWDISSAERLVRSGVKPSSVVFKRGHRVAKVLLDEGFDERVCISAIHRLTMPPQRRTVYWTIGHGETSFDAYDNFGMSSIARDIARDGYRNCALDLADKESIPSDCALIIIAGAKEDFSRVESARLDAYLRQGGRLLVLLSAVESGGIAPVLSRWGVRPESAMYPNARTLSGTDVITTKFADHSVTEPLSGSQIVLEKPIAFSPSAAIETATGADQLEFTALASVGEICVVASAERGVGTGEDLKLRPTRIVALGDASFAMNGSLAARANANRDFFLNCVSYLSGTDAFNEAGEDVGIIASGMDRDEKLKFIISYAVGFPIIFLLLFSFKFVIRRNR